MVERDYFLKMELLFLVRAIEILNGMNTEGRDWEAYAKLLEDFALRNIKA